MNGWPDDLGAMRIVRNRGLRQRAIGANRLFSEFNALYFGARLPSVRVRYSLRTSPTRFRNGKFELKLKPRGTYATWTPRFLFEGRGKNRRIRSNDDNVRVRVITLDALAEPEMLPAVLLHEMIHAADFGPHDEAFAAEARRLKALGAPVGEEDMMPEAGVSRPSRSS